MKDEVCPDENYEEIGPDTPIEEFVVKSKLESDLKIEDFEKMIDYNLKLVGVTLKKIEIERNSDDEIAL